MPENATRAEEELLISQAMNRPIEGSPTYVTGGDVSRANETVEAIQQQLADLQAQFESESATLADKVDPLTEALESISVKPKKTDIQVQIVTLAWAPYWQDEQGNTTPAW